MTLNDSDLWVAYKETVFLADTPLGELSIRVGTLEPKLDSLLRESGTEEWAFITAHNPRSQQLDAAENKLRHDQLKDKVAALGYPYFAGRGIGSDPAWRPEESLFILGMSRDDALEFGKTFGQNAVVCGRLGQLAELVDCRPMEG